MPTSGEEPALLVDTSAAVALCVADHSGHEAVFNALRGRTLGLAGHAAFETYSVLTRLPPPARLTPSAASRLLRTNFPHTRFLTPRAAAELLESLPTLGIAGGLAYDALVGAAAREHHLVLGTRDRRAIGTYRALDVEIELIGGDAVPAGAGGAG
jgi:predicted nucleic acid-binding protein